MAAMPAQVETVTPDLRSMGRPDEGDLDVSATLSDFLTYTEHLPSSVARSMALIEDQDRLATDLQQTIHNLLTTYANLSHRTDQNEALASVTLRTQISIANSKLQRARRLAAAEAYRLSELVTRDRQRLQIISRKLKAMPLPPSRDPTPVPAAVISPNLNKIAQRHSDDKTSANNPSVGTSAREKLQKLLVVVPGEVLPPMEQQPLLFDSDDTDSEASAMHSPAQASRHGRKDRLKVGNRHGTARPPKVPKKTAREGQLLDSGPTTNVPGVSTSTALLALISPPEDAKPGSIWKPWKRITEFELAKLRKRMKKNAIWLPSPAMRNRELRLLGRGSDGMEAALAHAAATGEPFIDEFTSNWQDPTRAVAPGQVNADVATLQASPIRLSGTGLDDDDDGNDHTINRGMLLNEAKKRKRERELEEQAVEAATAATAEVTGPLVSETQEVLDPSVSVTRSPVTIMPRPAESQPTQQGEQKEASPPRSLQYVDTATHLKEQLESPVDVKPSIEGKHDSAAPQNVNLAEDMAHAQPVQLLGKAEESSLLEKPENHQPELSHAADVCPEQPEAEKDKNITHVALPIDVENDTHARSDPIHEAAPNPKVVELNASGRKRKRAMTPQHATSTSIAPDVPQSQESPQPQSKRLRISVPAPSNEVTASPEPAEAPVSADCPAMSRSPSQAIAKSSMAKKQPTPSDHASRTRKLSNSGPLRQTTRRSLKLAKAASAEPPPQNRRASLRRPSNISLPGSANPSGSSSTAATPVTRGSTRGSKPRPNPGLVTTTDEYGRAKSSVGRRKNAPKKKARRRSSVAKKSSNEPAPESEDDGEVVDPDEPRYCICDDVSYGEMIACYMASVSGSPVVSRGLR